MGIDKQSKTFQRAVINIMMCITGQILGYQDLMKNHQKTFFGQLSTAANNPFKKPSRGTQKS